MTSLLCESHASFGSHAPNARAEPISCGTTILCCEFDGGVMLAADTRTSTGSFVVHHSSDKLTEITPYIFVCRSGASSDTQAIADIVRYQLEYFENEHGHRAPVKIAAELFRDMCYRYRDDLSAGVLVGGWDEQNGGQVFCVTHGGMIVKMPLACGGSGSTYIHGYLDSQYRKGMSRDDCEKFLKNCIALAINRDGSSGGCIRLATINSAGVQRKLFVGDEIPKFGSGLQ